MGLMVCFCRLGNGKSWNIETGQKRGTSHCQVCIRRGRRGQWFWRQWMEESLHKLVTIGNYWELWNKVNHGMILRLTIWQLMQDFIHPQDVPNSFHDPFWSRSWYFPGTKFDITPENWITRATPNTIWAYPTKLVLSLGLCVSLNCHIFPI